MRNPQHRMERILMTAIAVFLSVPLVVGIIFEFKTHVPPWAHWLMNTTLSGVQIKQTPVPFSTKALFDARYQASLATQFNDNFAGREFLIRLTNEIYFRVFKASPMPSSGVVVGRNNMLFESVYLEEYACERIAREQLEQSVKNAKQLQDECVRRGIGFVLLITPNKAGIYAEDIPQAWRERYDPRPRAYEQLVSLLQEQGVRYVDGHAITMETKGRSPVSVFPKGGIHWGEAAVAGTANQILNAMNAQGKNFKAIDESAFRISTSPIGEDSDILQLMNLAIDWSYPVLLLNQKPLTPKPVSNMVIVGGSFMWKLAKILSASQQFSEIECYYYYKTSKKSFVDGIFSDVSEPVTSIDFDREFFAADCLVLEVNEQTLPQAENNLTRFLPDILAHLPASEKKAPFLSEIFYHYNWGDEISFRNVDPNAIRAQHLSGFYKPAEEHTLTRGHDAIVRLNVPPTQSDITLNVKVAAVIDPNDVRQQHTVIYANDEQIGEWTVPSQEMGNFQAYIPARLIGKGGEFFLRFHIDHPVNPGRPREDDPYNLGLSFVKMRLSQPGN